MEEIYKALLFICGSEAADVGGTYVNCSTNGFEMEGNPLGRELIHKKGLGRALLDEIPRNLIMMCGGTLALYGLDRLLNIDDQSINFHKVFAYGVAGGLKYFNGLAHFAFAMIGRHYNKRLEREGEIKIIF